MIRLRRWAEALCLLVWAGAALADTPLPPPEDFTHTHPDAVVTGLADANRTIISQIGVPGSPNWSIPVWAWFYHLGPMGDSILVMQPGGNLIGSRDPATVAATVWYLEGDAIRSKPFRLGDLVDPQRLPQTASNFVLYTAIEAGPEGWRLQMGDGSRITITYR